MTIVVVLGVSLVVACLALLFLPYGERYKTTTQKFSGLGIDLEISLLTVLMLAGVVMALVPVAIPLYWEMQQVSAQLDAAKRDGEAARGEIQALQRALEQAQKFDVWALVTLEGVTEQDRPRLNDVECTYALFGQREAVRAAVGFGVAANQFRILLMDVDRKTVVQRLVLQEPGKRRWVYENFVPMEPTFVLRREK